MIEFKGTKGKFEVVEHNWSDTSLVCGNKTIATLSIYDEATEDNQEELEFEVSENFRLLSKAPEMLEMLRRCALEFGMYKAKFGQGSKLESEIINLIQSATEIK